MMLMHFFYLSQRDITIVPSLTCLIFWLLGTVRSYVQHVSSRANVYDHCDAA